MRQGLLQHIDIPVESATHAGILSLMTTTLQNALYFIGHLSQVSKSCRRKKGENLGPLYANQVLSCRLCSQKNYAMSAMKPSLCHKPITHMRFWCRFEALCRRKCALFFYERYDLWNPGSKQYWGSAAPKWYEILSVSSLPLCHNEALPVLILTRSIPFLPELLFESTPDCLGVLPHFSHLLIRCTHLDEQPSGISSSKQSGFVLPWCR